MLFITGAAAANGALLALAVLITLATACAGVDLYMLQPNQAAVLTLFGDYRGTDRGPGLRWTNPLYHDDEVTLIGEVDEVNDSLASELEERLGAAGVGCSRRG